jgi:hypothetical protein
VLAIGLGQFGIGLAGLLATAKALVSQGLTLRAIRSDR